MLTIWSKNAVLALSMASVGQAFQANRAGKVSTTALHVATDPSVVTKKEYQDICGVNFDKRSLQERLQATNFLYPKHVEVIEDIAPIAGAMVDEIVSIVIGLPAFRPVEFERGRERAEDTTSEYSVSHRFGFCVHTVVPAHVLTYLSALSPLFSFFYSF
jgi:hypothetical protein